MTTQPAAERVAVREWTNDTKFRSDSPLTAMSLEHNAVVAALRATLAREAAYEDGQHKYQRQLEAALTDAARWKAALEQIDMQANRPGRGRILAIRALCCQALTAPREGERI